MATGQRSAMEWSATEVALIISTTATALTSVGGVAIPLLKDHLEKRTQRREAAYSRLADAVAFCIENVDEAIRHHREAVIQHAYVDAGMTAGGFDEDLSKIDRSYLKNLRLVELFAAEIGIEVDAFIVAASRIRGTHLKFEVQDGKLVADPRNQEVMEVHFNSRAVLTEEGAKSLASAKSKLGMKY